MPTSRWLTIIAQDPSIKDSKGEILKAKVEIPYEELGEGPRGHRVHVVDYDATQKVLYKPYDLKEDLFINAKDSELLGNPFFHAQNTYAIIMRLLARFEKALGRRLSWSFGGHQLQILPHGFAEANAFYSSDVHSIFFGYFPTKNGKVGYTSLSHDIIAHETTHALLDGLRGSYLIPSDSEQAGFHEGFSDVVALLSVFGIKELLKNLLELMGPTKEKGISHSIDKKLLNVESLRKSVLFGLGKQIGQETSQFRADCLRRSVEMTIEKFEKEGDYDEPHSRGEILTAAMLNSFIDVWIVRLKSWLPTEDKYVSLDRVAEDGIDAAEQLLTMCIRALDYSPVVDITFADFLTALLTADYKVIPDDGKYKYRDALIKQFAQWKIKPISEVGFWNDVQERDAYSYEGIHRESLEKNPEEIFKFIWINRKKLELWEKAYAWVISVRPCIRIAPDGFVLKETVAEYRQVLDIEAREFANICKGMNKPGDMPGDTQIRIQGGGVLIFDEFGKLNYHIHSKINAPDRQNKKLAYLWENGIKDTAGRYGISSGVRKSLLFGEMHLRKNKMPQMTSELNDWEQKNVAE